MSAVLFDSNTVEMTTAEHDLTKFFELLACQNAVEMMTAEHDLTKFFEFLACQCYSFGELKFILATCTFI